MNRETAVTPGDRVQTVIDEIAARFTIEGIAHQRPDQCYLHAGASELVAVLTHLKQLSGYHHLSFFTAVDRMESGHFDLLYLVHNYELGHDIGVFVSIPREGERCRMESIHHLWPAAETYQRELREMFGIDFPGSPRLNDDFALEGWDDLPPMRRDFDTREYSERVYYARPGRRSEDTRAHMKSRLYPSEAETW